ncbi:hypothetical protein [Flavobacterium sp. Root186]|uniref:hypothetical protein n=1 Tax=Flavobacterium sp. Root186 TaxID=1736485 RepID=UPI000AAE0360|nr:hypothetical protein [Flavobacterium sp. Root186]
MEEKTCLLIDNENQISSIETIEREGKKIGTTIKCYQFNVGSTNNPEFLTDNKIDLKKVIAEFHKQYGGITFDLIAFDWSLDDDEINGVELIKCFQDNKLRRSTPKLLYSGELKVEMEGLLNLYKDEKIEFKKAWNQIKTLVEIDIVDFKDRDEYEMAIVKYLHKNNPSLETVLVKELRNNSDLKFLGNFEKFENLTFAEIASIIENDPDRSIHFKKGLIEESIAFLVDLKNHSDE